MQTALPSLPARRAVYVITLSGVLLRACLSSGPRGRSWDASRSSRPRLCLLLSAYENCSGFRKAFTDSASVRTLQEPFSSFALVCFSFFAAPVVLLLYIFFVLVVHAAIRLPAAIAVSLPAGVNIRTRVERESGIGR